MKVLVIDGHPLMRSAIKREIKDHKPQARVTLVGQLDEAVKLIDNQLFDIVIFEIGIPGASMHTIREMRATGKAGKILVFSSMSETIYALPAVSSGANGFLSKDSSGDELRIAVDMMLDSKTYFSKTIQETLLSQVIANVDATDHNPLQTLTQRERLVVHLLLQGNKIRTIAEMLDLKESTVSTFKANVFKKLQVSNLVALSAKMEMLR
ncbi:DNA-binding response regulator, NarL/FixJ family, contains REC and HTH domains [Dyadobacter soli]|uniref:DNA-binding response regulator, NarL/FixJ family, contains REC and HTH domains n=1 Tax=Dyadobacter soli TaxID=659014 RepID=A0A1G7CWL8_9BACT|nr:response regulator transcription factor [Dyadobacter soli]SDE43633.1 DNA-binding response regulator, NarL/FixJ family, contains REC and HTH domains [Dyadobacter soli]